MEKNIIAWKKHKTRRVLFIVIDSHFYMHVIGICHLCLIHDNLNVASTRWSRERLVKQNRLVELNLTEVKSKEICITHELIVAWL